MIEAHVLNVMLRPELREGAAFRVVDYVNGLVAPAFLLTAGLVFALATGPATSPTVRRMSDLKTWGPRLALLWGLGYLLRAPGLWPPRPSSWSSAEWDTFLSVDVLHCIAATWAILLVVHVTVRGRWTRVAVLAGLWILGLALTPIAWESDAIVESTGWAAHYLTPHTGSLFPVLPWGSYVAAGALVGRLLRSPGLVQHMKTGAATPRIRSGMLGLGATALTLAVLIFRGVQLLPSTAWTADPFTVVARTILTGTILSVLLVSIDAPGKGLRSSSRGGGLGRWTAFVGRQSLFVYVAHLLVLYRVDWQHVSLAGAFESRLGWVAVLGIVGGVTVITVGLAWGWQSLSDLPWYQRYGLASIIVLAALW